MTIIEKARKEYPYKKRRIAGPLPGAGEEYIVDDNLTPRSAYIAGASWVRDELWKWAEEWLKSAERFHYSQQEMIVCRDLCQKLNNM